MRDISTELISRAVSFFQQQNEECPHERVFDVCATGLQSICENIFTIESSLISTVGYFQEMGDLLAVFEAHPTPAIQDPQAVAFSLCENIAVVLREWHVRTGKGNNSRVHAVFQFFEESGHWTPGDGTLVASCYHQL